VARCAKGLLTLQRFQPLAEHSSLADSLRLQPNSKHDRIIKASQGLRFLGVMLYPKDRILMKRNRCRVETRLNWVNAASYYGLVQKHGNSEWKRLFSWFTLK